MLRKRSLRLSGHTTSLALEPEFWAALDVMASEGGRSLTSMIAEIDAGRAAQPLASACRIAALAWAGRRRV
jgi:predicted DNA-binding ribbon-helix-helix protein